MIRPKSNREHKLFLSELLSEKLDRMFCPISGNKTNRWAGSPAPVISASDTVTVSSRTDALVRGLLLILEHHGARANIQEGLKSQLHSYLDNSLDESVWLKRSKYVLTYPLSRYLRNEPPSSPDVVFRPSGALRGWMKQRLVAFNRKNTHLWTSWVQAKRATLPASDQIVQAAFDKHYDGLTKADPGDDQVIKEIVYNPIFLRVLEKVRTESAQLLSKAKGVECGNASKSACFENTRSRGGQQGRLLELCSIDNSLLDRELVAMRFDVVVYARLPRYNVCTVIRCRAGREQWARLASLSASMKLDNPVKCTIQAVLEPMKVRVISKGEALPYYTCRSLQHALHSAMRGLDCFRLIGRPLSPTDFLDLKKLSAPNDHWFSVDYSAATDNLSWKYSGWIFRFLCSALDEHQYRCAMRVLGPHDLYYPEFLQGEYTGDAVFRGRQQNGQLMGSILSFPVLCLANLGVYLHVTNESQKGWTDEERLRHVLVNGDDMVYAANPSLWDEHVAVAAKVGLEMSVGKAYHHPVYANVNSTSVHLDLSSRFLIGEGPWKRSKVFPETPWQINYLNVGLYYGQHKVQSKDRGDEQVDMPRCKIATEEQVNRLLAAAHMGQDPDQGLVVNLGTLLNGALPGKQPAILSRFLSENAQAVRRECAIVVRSGGRRSLATRNLFLPLSVGGMGVLPPPRWKYEIKKVQRYIAEAFIQQNCAPVTGGMPLPGYALSKIESELSVPWSKKEMNPLFTSCTLPEVCCRKSRARAGIFRYGTSSLAVVA